LWRFPSCSCGKDGTPFVVHREMYDKTIETMNAALGAFERSDRVAALKRLSRFAYRAG
jgi:hypothetical protein